MKNRTQILVYGLLLGGLAILLKIVEYRYIVYDYPLEVYGGIIALIFTVVGVWLGIKLKERRARLLSAGSPASTFSVDPVLLQEMGISKREYDVLELIALGFSTQEIADKLFVSRNTVKTHAASLFQKLDAKRRTQAVQKAKSLGLLP